MSEPTVTAPAPADETGTPVAGQQRSNWIAQIIDAFTALIKAVKEMTSSQVMSAMLLIVVVVLSGTNVALSTRNQSSGTNEAVGMVLREQNDQREKDMGKLVTLTDKIERLAENERALAESVGALSKAVNRVSAKWPDPIAPTPHSKADSD